MDTIVGRTIRERIDAEGPITFATFMELALYGPGGFYEHPPVGVRGDFVTSPHVHPAFGSFVASAIEQLAASLAIDGPLRLTEVGGGDGTLARQLLEHLPGTSYAAVEASEGARRALASIPGVVVADELHRPVDVVLAHELLDNLPFRVVRGDDEVLIDAKSELVERLAPIDDELRRSLGERHGDLVVPVGAFAFIDRVADALDRGYALLIDYGSEGDGGPIHGYRGHRIVEDVLADPGSTDITAGVDFAWVAEHGRSRGLQTFPSVSQRSALMALGFAGWLRSELETQRRQLDERDGIGAVRTWSMRSRAMMLVDPSALGRARWMLLATPKLPEPDWLRAAREDRSAD